MRKIYLLFALSIVSVFSIAAQTNSKTAENLSADEISTEAVEKVKVETENPKTVIDAPQITGTAIPETNISENRKAKEGEIKDKSGLKVVKTEISFENKIDKKIENKTPSPILTAKTSSLGGLSTGNAAVDGYIEEFSALYDVDPLLIYAQMSQESSFRSRATSAKGASGFMQLMPDTARRFGVTNVYNPKQNIKAGVKYMRWLLDKFGGDPRLALAGYNAGEGSVIKYGNKIPPYRETRNYVAKIMAHYEQIANQNSTVARSESQPDGAKEN